ncbi:MAG: hypothetical protein JJ855_19705 [Rhodospirillales bacterium]|nr:hypothetical protein [Rhodospirillales bacterium]
MEYHIDRRLKLVTEVEHSSLYKWCILEVEENGETAGRGQIPWAWSHDFSAHDLTHRISLQGDRESFNIHLKEGEVSEAGFENQEPKVPEVKDEEEIYGTLRPSYRPDGFPSQTQFSMFGTDRIINTFTLRIRPTDKEEELTAWGCVSYTSEVDFRVETTPDCIEFYLSLSRERFSKLVELVRSGRVSGASLRICYVRGFYSGWSPSISTDLVKVLCIGSEQEVEIPEGCTIEPPRLGKIGEFSFNLHSKLSFDVPKDVEREDTGDEDIDLLDVTEMDEVINSQTIALTGFQRALKAAQRPLWAIFFVLVLILLNLT